MANEVPGYYAQAIITFFQLPGAEIAPLLETLQLDPALLEEQRLETAIDADDFGRLFMGMLKLAQRELSENPEQVVELSDFRLLYSYMLQGKTLRDALQRGSQFLSRFQSQQQGIELLADDQQASLQLDPIDSAEDAISRRHFSMDAISWLPGLEGRMIALYIWHRLCSWLIGNFIDLDGVNLDYPLDGDADDYIQPFRSPVYFNQSHSSLAFHPRYLAMPVIRSESELQLLLETFPAELFKTDAMADSTLARVRGLVGNNYASLPSLEEVASRLHMTTPTLHRRLRAEGTSYQQIKDGCRRDAAIACLRKGDTGAAVAEKLGFSDASTFYRAFKKWTGMTPQDFLQQEA